jgi:zinc transporter ZupT
MLSGVSEPLGAALGWLVLRNHFNELAYAILFGLVAGECRLCRGAGC